MTDNSRYFRYEVGPYSTPMSSILMTVRNKSSAFSPPERWSERGKNIDFPSVPSTSTQAAQHLATCTHPSRAEGRGKQVLLPQPPCAAHPLTGQLVGTLQGSGQLGCRRQAEGWVQKEKCKQLPLPFVSPALPGPNRCLTANAEALEISS